MRHKMSVSIDEKLIERIRKVMREKRIYRSKSHVIEEALHHFLEENKGAISKK